MNATLLRTLHELFDAYERPQTEAQQLRVFRSAGITDDPGDTAAGRQFCDETGIPPAVVWSAVEAYQLDREAQRETQRAQAIREAIDRISGMVVETHQKPDARPADLLRQLEAITATAREASADAGGIDRQALLQPTTRADFVEAVQNKPEAFETSYQFATDAGPEPLVFQTGALSMVAAPTGHGKTTMLLNLLVDAAARYPERRHWLFTFEESAPAVLLKALNVMVDADLSRNNRRTLEAYYRTGSTDYFSHYNDPDTNRAGTRLDRFRDRESLFWQAVEHGVINVVEAQDMDADTLTEAIRAIATDRPGLALVDYLGLVYRSDRDRYTQRNEELKHIAGDLKNVAVDTGLPVVAAVQFSREVMAPQDMAPQRLAESADLERAANKVVGLWNGDKTSWIDKKRGAKSGARAMGIEPGHMYMEVLKARDEASGTASVFDYSGNRGVIGHAGSKPTPPRDDDGGAGGRRNGSKAAAARMGGA